MVGEFPAQRASNAENVSIWWRHHYIPYGVQLNSHGQILFNTYWLSVCIATSDLSFMMTSSNGNISALLAICGGNSPVPGEFPTQRPVTRSFDVFFDLLLNKRLSKQSWGWWFETLSRPLWRHCNASFSDLSQLTKNKATLSYFWSNLLFRTQMHGIGVPLSLLYLSCSCFWYQLAFRNQLWHVAIKDINFAKFLHGNAFHCINKPSWFLLAHVVREFGSKYNYFLAK